MTVILMLLVTSEYCWIFLLVLSAVFFVFTAVFISLSIEHSKYGPSSKGHGRGSKNRVGQFFTATRLKRGVTRVEDASSHGKK